MHKDLTRYYRQLDHQLSQFEDDLPTHSRLVEAYQHHRAHVQDFQHERLIHLLVTLFFAGLTIISLICQFLILGSNAISPVLGWTVGVLTMILLVTDVAYVWHYYHLENGTQRLYRLTRRLEELLQKAR